MINNSTKSSPESLLVTAKHLAFNTLLPEDLQNNLGKLNKYLVSADFLPSAVPASKTLSDEELTKIEAEIFGSDDIEAVVHMSLHDCVSTTACGITACGLQWLDPVLSILISNSTPIDVVLALSITEAVPVATTESSASGGAVRRVLGAHTNLALHSGDMAGSFMCRPALDLPTISVSKITTF